MAQKMPKCWNDRRVFAKLDAVKNVEHKFCGKLIDGESVKCLQSKPSLKTLLN